MNLIFQALFISSAMLAGCDRPHDPSVCLSPAEVSTIRRDLDADTSDAVKLSDLLDSAADRKIIRRKFRTSAEKLLTHRISRLEKLLDKITNPKGSRSKISSKKSSNPVNQPNSNTPK